MIDEINDVNSFTRLCRADDSHRFIERKKDQLFFIARINRLAVNLNLIPRENLITYIFEPLFDNFWAPIIRPLSDWLGNAGFIHNLLIGKLVEGEIEFVESLGLLTTGLFVPIGMVLPYVVSFYLVLSFPVPLWIKIISSESVFL